MVKELPDELQTGIYFGWANVDNGEIYKAVLSLGWNPFFKNKEKSLVSEYRLAQQKETNIIDENQRSNQNVAPNNK